MEERNLELWGQATSWPEEESWADERNPTPEYGDTHTRRARQNNKSGNLTTGARLALIGYMPLDQLSIFGIYSFDYLSV